MNPKIVSVAQDPVRKKTEIGVLRWSDEEISSSNFAHCLQNADTKKGNNVVLPEGGLV